MPVNRDEDAETRLSRERWSKYPVVTQKNQDPFYYEIYGFGARSIILVPESHVPKSRQVVNLSAVKSWITECVNSHQECDDKTSNRGLILKVIDCLKREVCIAPAGAAYVCLSYVWGTESDLGQPSHSTLGDLPRTVEDAIYTTLELGFRYLWIDRYCIDQANEAEKHYTINNMDIIYQGADLTIIAAAGDGPHTGLPGTLNTPRCPQPTVNLGLTRCVVVEDYENEIKNSLWYTRGWTFQEMLLSRRCLVFTPSQLYFQCKNSHRASPVELGLTKDHFRAALPTLVKGGADIDAIRQRLEEYYLRHISYATDTVRAFVGIFNAANSEETTQQLSHFYGVPFEHHRKHASELARCSFVESLCWSVVGSRVPRSSTINENGLFPSWSWASIASKWPHHIKGSLHCLRGSGKSSYDTRVFVHHRERGSVELAEYTADWGNDDIFHPYIDLESWATVVPITANVNHGEMNEYLLPGFKRFYLMKLDHPYDSFLRTVVVICIRYVDPYPAYIEPGAAIFLLLTTGRNFTHLRVGYLKSTLGSEGNKSYHRAADILGGISPQIPVQTETVPESELPTAAVEGIWRRCKLRIA